MVTIKIKIMNPKLTMYACHIYISRLKYRGEAPQLEKEYHSKRILRELKEIGNCYRYYSYCY